LDGKHFLKVVKKLEGHVIWWLYQIWSSNFWLLYILFWIFFFQFHPLEFDLIWFDFYINFGPHFYDCYLLFSYHFLNWIFLSIRFDLYFFIVIFFYLKLIYEIVIFLILSSFNFFIC
jgi:hypothetical protein